MNSNKDESAGTTSAAAPRVHHLVQQLLMLRSQPLPDLRTVST